MSKTTIEEATNNGGISELIATNQQPGENWCALFGVVTNYGKTTFALEKGGSTIWNPSPEDIDECGICQRQLISYEVREFGSKQELIRNATWDEVKSSWIASLSDNGRGIIVVNSIKCYAC